MRCRYSRGRKEGLPRFASGVAVLLRTIAQTGRIAVAHPTQDPPGLRDLLEQDVAEHEAVQRLDLVHPPPAFDPVAGVWASGVLYRCCQFLVYRDIDADTVTRTLTDMLAPPRDASICYSVDVAFSYLPDVFHLARGITPGDPLVVGLRRLAQMWPLSSVGIPDVGEIDVSTFIEHPCLRELYVQRIVQRRDQRRLDHPAVRVALRQAVGAYPELASELKLDLNLEPALKPATTIAKENP